MLSRLESKIESLLTRLATLKEDNARLRDEVQRGQEDLMAENRRLREDLERERASKEEVLARIDGLLQKLQDETA
ncbi:cell division protein ZapB [Desulfocurvus sp.]|uniref:cell division protein ZapB n=1 Tax=Desulfocurvus sp. TaxID=2871698 RepID=UPI0025BC0D54|nr:cell division protein ZapB [Desulfocurvus sp.]MCK9241451.1 cell division protein ZapB [Desulfocurvus sp.]